MHLKSEILVHLRPFSTVVVVFFLLSVVFFMSLVYGFLFLNMLLENLIFYSNREEFGVL